MVAPPIAPPPAAPTALSPPQPTLRLPRNFVPTAYALELAIDPAATGFTGDVAITGNVSEKSAVIWLHGRKLAIKTATATSVAGGAPVCHRGDRGRRGSLEARARRAARCGRAGSSSSRTAATTTRSTAPVHSFKQSAEGEPYVFSQFEAIYARRAFPCFDEPDVKVPWTITLDIPSALVGVSNAPLASQHPLDGTHTRLEFAPTKPLPSYLVAFGVGPFDIVDAGQDQARRAGAHHRAPSSRQRTRRSRRRSPRACSICSSRETTWFDRPYPFDKLDILTIPLTTGFSAMENAGLVTFTETAVLFEPQQLS